MKGTVRVPAAGVLRVVDGLHLLDLALGVVLDHELERAEHREAARRRPVEDVPDLVLEHLDLDGGLALAADADDVEEVAQALGREAAPAQRRDGRHARVVPAAHVALARRAARGSASRARCR